MFFLKKARNVLLIDEEGVQSLFIGGDERAPRHSAEHLARGYRPQAVCLRRALVDGGQPS
eukprot:SAG31_NODE_2803_length_5072_cov_3.559421_6_plen_60_part_00